MLHKTRFTRLIYPVNLPGFVQIDLLQSDAEMVNKATEILKEHYKMHLILKKNITMQTETKNIYVIMFNRD